MSLQRFHRWRVSGETWRWFIVLHCLRNVSIRSIMQVEDEPATIKYCSPSSSTKTSCEKTRHQHHNPCGPFPVPRKPPPKLSKGRGGHFATACQRMDLNFVFMVAFPAGSRESLQTFIGIGLMYSWLCRCNLWVGRGSSPQLLLREWAAYNY